MEDTLKTIKRKGDFKNTISKKRNPCNRVTIELASANKSTCEIGESTLDVIHNETHREKGAGEGNRSQNFKPWENMKEKIEKEAEEMFEI